MNSLDIQTELNSGYYLGAIAFTLLFYDYFLTFEWEISRYWSSGSKITWPTVLFFLNRYGSLLGNIPVVIQTFWTTPSTPQKSASYHQYFLIAIQVLVGALLILRTYALYERNNRVLAFMLVIAGGVIGVCIVRLVQKIQFHCLFTQILVVEVAGPTDARNGCCGRSIGLIIAWVALVLFDCIIFFLTFYRALNHRSTGARLLTVLLRDGSIYFGSDYTRGVAATFANTISSIMISRLMLNLRDPVLSNTGFQNMHLNFSMFEFAESRDINTNV
ncbi:hypothetical protein B0H11DRAFT_2141427 [Mycena galericulata]|nr:hypothetical protein B0H11DRAFT_2141427 [Mycena galericulata]